MPMNARAAARLATVATWLACAAAPLRAQTEPTPTAPAALTGTLAKVRDAGAVTIGYRESSVPFSYLSSRGEPIGYSIELCKALVDAIGDAVHKTLAIRWVAVNPTTNFVYVTNESRDTVSIDTMSRLPA